MNCPESNRKEKGLAMLTGCFLMYKIALILSFVLLLNKYQVNGL